MEDKVEELEADVLLLGEKLDFKENELAEILESYEDDIIYKMDKLHAELSADIKYWEEKYTKEESRSGDLIVENEQLMTKLNRIEREFNECNDKLQQTNIKLNDAIKGNIVKDNEIDRLNVLVRDGNELSNSDRHSDKDDIEVNNMGGGNEVNTSLNNTIDTLPSNLITDRS